jgi:hypothetical protein
MSRTVIIIVVVIAVVVIICCCCALLGSLIFFLPWETSIEELGAYGIPGLMAQSPRAFMATATLM